MEIDWANKKAILFDNDGVLTHTEKFWLEINSAIAKQIGIAYTRDDFVKHTFTTGLGSDGWLKEAGYDEEKRNQFRSLRDARAREGLLEATSADLSSGRMVAILKEKYRLVVVTNTNQELFTLLSQRFKFLNQFDRHILREDYAHSKPEPDSYQAALKVLDIKPAEAVVIEDSPRGIKAAKAAGIEVVGIKNPDFAELDLSESDLQIEKLDDLVELVTNH